MRRLAVTDFTCLTSPGENWLGLHKRLHQEKTGWDHTSDFARRKLAVTDFTCLTSPGENWLGLHIRLHQGKIGWDRTSDFTRRLAGTHIRLHPGHLGHERLFGEGFSGVHVCMIVTAPFFFRLTLALRCRKPCSPVEKPTTLAQPTASWDVSILAALERSHICWQLL